MPAQTVIKVRRDTAENWASTNPVLAAGEHGFETNTGKFKIGDGTTAYVSLEYATDWANITEKPTFGTSASKDVASTGDASSTQVVLGNDSRLTDSRTPTAHKTSHEFGGSDALTLAQSQVTNLSTDLAAKAPLENPTFTRINTTDEGGQINFARSSDNAMAWAIDAFGSSSTPDLRIIDGTTVRASFNSGIGMTVNGTLTANPAVPANANTAKAVGYIGMPQTLLASGGLTLSAAHAGDHIYVTGTGQTITIPANASVPFEIGTTIVIINAAAVTTSIAITSDTLLLAGAGTTGTRTLAAHGMATLVKITATSWIISGNGLS